MLNKILYRSITYTQAARGARLKKSPSSRTFKLRGPQVAGLCWRIFMFAPKKPNSGHRRTVKVKIKTKKRDDRLTARLTSYACWPSKYCRLLIEGGRMNDTPGVTYTAIRGAYDMPAHERRIRRSIYGNKRVIERVVKVRRSARMSGLKCGCAWRIFVNNLYFSVNFKHNFALCFNESSKTFYFKHFIFTNITNNIAFNK